MTWRSFVEYVVMRELGQEDAVQRNYDLSNLNGSKPGQVLDRAFAMMGFDQKHTPRAFVLSTIRSHLNNMGYRAPKDDAFADLIRSWYNWHRIRTGQLQRFPLKAIKDNPLL